MPGELILIIEDNEYNRKLVRDVTAILHIFLKGAST
jgi:hypothetical protein